VGPGAIAKEPAARTQELPGQAHRPKEGVGPCRRRGKRDLKEIRACRLNEKVSQVDRPPSEGRQGAKAEEVGLATWPPDARGQHPTKRSPASAHETPPARSGRHGSGRQRFPVTA
jgi:hypothetical protein